MPQFTKHILYDGEMATESIDIRVAIWLAVGRRRVETVYFLSACDGKWSERFSASAVVYNQPIHMGI